MIQKKEFIEASNLWPEVMSWAGTPLHDEVGDFKNRNVGVFYFLWQGDVASKTSDNKWISAKLYQITLRC